VIGAADLLKAGPALAGPWVLLFAVFILVAKIFAFGVLTSFLPTLTAG